ncbi:hypothetical protein HanPSC8_Chr13g0552201 [Helianthus annuus]|nr:hypothetical protein HanPSC8_Chr13g0552201 [Helianthus annuus]
MKTMMMIDPVDFFKPSICCLHSSKMIIIYIYDNIKTNPHMGLFFSTSRIVGYRCGLVAYTLKILLNIMPKP